MPRAARKDEPGAWHHVTARGIAKRTIFERREDFRMFFSLLAREVRRGDIEDETTVLKFEAGGKTLVLVSSQMSYHHVAQGVMEGEPWMVTFMRKSASVPRIIVSCTASTPGPVEKRWAIGKKMVCSAVATAVP